jgi:hypothetical protein
MEDCGIRSDPRAKHSCSLQALRTGLVQKCENDHGREKICCNIVNKIARAIVSPRSFTT